MQTLWNKLYLLSFGFAFVCERPVSLLRSYLLFRITRFCKSGY